MLALTKSPHSHRVLEYSCVNFTMRPSTFNTAWWFPKEKCSPCHNNILFQEQKIFTGFTLDAEMHVWRKFCHQIIISYLSILQKSVEGQIGKDSANIDFARTSYSYNQNEINWHFKANFWHFPIDLLHICFWHNCDSLEKCEQFWICPLAFHCSKYWTFLWKAYEHI